MKTANQEAISSGELARRGLLPERAQEFAVEVLAQTEADGIETVRVVFPDQHGILRGKTVAARALPSLFTSGLSVPTTLLLKDTAHRTVFDVWTEGLELDGVAMDGAGDMTLVPDPATFVRLPWSPHSALIFCDPAHAAGSWVSVGSRRVLNVAMTRLRDVGYDALMGLEIEFQVFEVLDEARAHENATIPPAPLQTRNMTHGWAYLTESRYGEAEALLDDIRRTAEQLGLAPRSVEIEMGPSQFEFTFDPSDPLTQADRYVLFRAMVKEVCRRRGLHASFMAKPRLPNAAANGWHIHQSLTEIATARNAFTTQTAGTPTPACSAWIAGLLEHAASSCLLTTPTVNGYKRYTEFQLAPNRIQWGTDNRGAMVRALLPAGNPAARIENRVAETAANPYFALAAQIVSGLDGLTRGLKAPPPTTSPYATEAAALPASLIEAVEAFETSLLFREAIGPDFVRYLSHIKRAEWKRYVMTLSEWEQHEYFNLF